MQAVRFLLVLVLVLPLACSADSGATLACDRLYRLAGEADLLTLEEQRDRVQGIWDAASVAEDDALRDAARRMLSAITRNDSAGLEDATTDMSTACEDVEPL